MGRDEQIEWQKASDAAYLVSRGVRAIATMETTTPVLEFMTDELTHDTEVDYGPRDRPRLERVLEEVRLWTEQEPSAAVTLIPFVISWDGPDGTEYLECGFAVAQSVLETYTWLRETAPSPHRNRLIGLLHGYSVPAVERWADPGQAGTPLAEKAALPE